MVDNQKTVLTKVTNGWVPKGEKVIIAKRHIPGMIYICDSSKGKPSKKHSLHEFSIDTALTVTEGGNEDSDPGTYAYSRMDQESRGVYLDWLEDSRFITNFHKAYPRMYLHGLEHRLLNDQEVTEVDRQDIIGELLRMREVFEGEKDIDNMAQDILNIAELLRDPYGSKLISYPNQHFHFPVKVLTNLSSSIAAGKTLTADQMFDWIFSVPMPIFRKSTIKDKKLREKFVRVFNSEYGKGLEVRSPESFINLEYSALSGAFKIVKPFTHKGSPVLDIRYLNKPLYDAYKVAMFLFHPTSDPLYDTLGLMSEAGSFRYYRTERWKLEQYQLYNLVRIWATEMHERRTIYPAKYYIGYFLGKVIDKISATQWTSVERGLEYIGFGIAPNNKLYLDTPKRECPSVIYNLNNWTNEIPEYSLQYFALLNQLGICSHILHTLKLDTDESKSRLEQHINRLSDLTPIERAGLQAHVEYILENPPDKTYMTRFRKWITPENGDSFRQIIIDLVRGKRQFKPDTVSLLKKVYKSLLLDPQLAMSDLHAGEVSLSAKSKKSTTPEELDEKLIANIKNDSETVSTRLGEIFEADGQNSQQNGGVAENSPKNQNKTAIAGLDNKHTEFLIELLEKKFWTEDSFGKLAKKHGLLSIGAVETINEWAFERFEDALLEEHEGVRIATEIASKLKALYE